MIAAKSEIPNGMAKNTNQHPFMNVLKTSNTKTHLFAELEGICKMQVGQVQLVEFNVMFHHVVEEDFKIKIKPTMTAKHYS